MINGIVIVLLASLTYSSRSFIFHSNRKYSRSYLSVTSTTESVNLRNTAKELDNIGIAVQSKRESIDYYNVLKTVLISRDSTYNAQTPSHTDKIPLLYLPGLDGHGK